MSVNLRKSKNQTLSIAELTLKYSAVKRNFDAISRICQTKCKEITQLKNDLLLQSNDAKKYQAIKTKFDIISLNTEKLEENNLKLNEKLMEYEMYSSDMKEKLKTVHTSLNINRKICLNLESNINEKTDEIFHLQTKNKTIAQEFNNAKNMYQLLENDIQKSKENERHLQSQITALSADIQASNIQQIKYENIRLISEQKYQSLNEKYFYLNDKKFPKLQEKYIAIVTQNKELNIKYENNEMQTKVLQNRLQQLLKNTTDENLTSDKMKSFEKIISDLEHENRCNKDTICTLTKVQTEYKKLQIQNKKLKESKIQIENNFQQLNYTYNELHEKVRLKNEKYLKLTSDLNELEQVNENSVQNLKEKELEFTDLQTQYQTLYSTYNELEKQHKKYIDQQREILLSSKNAKESENEILLRADLNRVILENREWEDKNNKLQSLYLTINIDLQNSKIECQSYQSLYEELQLVNNKNTDILKSNQIEFEKYIKSESLHTKEIQKLNEKLIEKENTICMMECHPRLSINEYTLLVDKENELSDIISKFFLHEMSNEPFFKCLVCNEYYVNPVTCQPCGHSYCKICIKDTKDSVCIECKDMKRVKYYENDILRSLTDGYRLRMKTYLPKLKQIANRKTNVSRKII